MAADVRFVRDKLIVSGRSLCGECLSRSALVLGVFTTDVTFVARCLWR